MASPFIPQVTVPRVAAPLARNDAVWATVPKLAPFYVADGSALAAQQTTVSLCFDDAALHVRFDCKDRDIWGTYTQRDDPLYEQEVVECFIGAGAADPVHYFEFQVSPNGVLFDSTVFNPTSQRADMKWDIAWNCPDIRWSAQRDDTAHKWSAGLSIPWHILTEDGSVPPHCRANFYRIERPRDAETEYSCWSPTMTEPADFHKPAYFGVLHLETES